MVTSLLSLAQNKPVNNILFVVIVYLVSQNIRFLGARESGNVW